MSPNNLVLDWGCTLTPPGKFDRSICAAMRLVAASTIATCFNVISSLQWYLLSDKYLNSGNAHAFDTCYTGLVACDVVSNVR